MFLSGYLITFIFNYVTIEFYKNNCSNTDLIFFEIFFNWLFQQYIRQSFNITSGKYFMIKNDFRNKLVMQSIRILKIFIFWFCIINILQLGTLLINFGLLIYLKIHQLEKVVPEKLFKEIVYVFPIFYLITKTYTFFDFFLIIKLIFVIFLIFICNLSYNYTIKYVLLNVNVSLYYIFHKIFLYVCCNYIIFKIFIYNIEFQTENCIKEIFFKIICFIYFIH